MNRRQFALASLVSSVAAVSGCNSEPKPDALATLLNNPAVHKAFKDLEDSVNNLETHVGEFDTNNWREVVEDVRTDSSELSDGIEALKSALGYSDSN
jgi:hypothetical protein